MINTDSYYEIGAGHVYCQDYADSGTFVNEAKDNLYHFAIVCDGCSGSKDSDIGARWLAKNFPVIAKVAVDMKGTIQDNIRTLLLQAMTKGIAEMNVKNQAFDATLVALLYDQKLDTLHTFVWGDGKVFYKFKDRENGTLTDIGYVKNAPYYLSYLLNPNPEGLYSSMFGTMFADVTFNVVTPDALILTPERGLNFQKSYYECLKDASKILSFASVFTDGVDTYHVKDDVNKIMPRHNIFNQLTQYKNLHGKFVERRMQNVKKFCQKEGWQHFDDVSVSTITF